MTERVPASSKSLLLASKAVSADSTLAWATISEALATVSSFGCAKALVNRDAGLGEDRFGAVHAPFQIADGGDGERVLPAVILLAVDPGTGLARENFCLFKGA